ncbi:MAG TPA: sulfotransferase [Allosphingosinicella sp.]|nr:sulfotransferase [Allosphingosinicella sp.]
MTSTNGNGNGHGESGANRASIRDPELDRARLRAMHEALTGGDVPTAGKLAEDALGDGIDHPMVLNLVAGRREAEGRLDEALALLGRALAAAPEAIGVMNAIGLCLSRMGRFEEAVEAFGGAVAKAPDFAPALANRGAALLALGRNDEARADFEASRAADPANLIAADGLAALALGDGDAAAARTLAGQVLAREPGWPSAVLTLAGADLAEARAAEAEAALAALLADARLSPVDRALATGLRGDALEGLGRHGEAFAAWRESNGLQAELHAPRFAGRPTTLALVRDLTGALAGRRVPAAWGHGGRSPAKRHVFLVGFPGSGTAAVERALAAHPEVATLADKEALIDSARDWLADADRFARFCDLEDEALETYREAYWRRVAEEGVDPAGKVFVDRHAFNLFKLPLIARLFPDARVLVAGRDPRDAVLEAFRARWRMTDPAWQLLTLEGAAALYAATLAMVEASEEAFGLFTHRLEREALRADADAELKALTAFVGLPWDEPLQGLVAEPDGVGRWRHHAAEIEAAMAGA